MVQKLGARRAGRKNVTSSGTGVEGDERKDLVGPGREAEEGTLTHPPKRSGPLDVAGPIQRQEAGNHEREVVFRCRVPLLCLTAASLTCSLPHLLALMLSPADGLISVSGKSGSEFRKVL